MFRYIGILAAASDAPAHCIAERLRAKTGTLAGDWRCAFRSPQLAVYATTDAGGLRVLAGANGVIVGSLFHTQRLRESPCADPPVKNDPLTVDFLLRGGPHRLVTDCWGEYVAFCFQDQEQTAWVLKAPTGALPCLHQRHGGVHVFASHPADLAALGMARIRASLDYLRRRVASVDITRHSEALEGVESLVGGEAIQVDLRRTPPSVTRGQYWRPDVFCRADARIRDTDLARQQLRGTIGCAAHSCVHGQSRVLHRLSGGLDSSIVLAALAHAAPEVSVTSYTYYHPGGRADERPWARLTLQRLPGAHFERAFVPEQAPLERIASFAPTPEPVPILPYLQRAPLERELAQQLGVGVVTNGAGGDSGFCRECIALTPADFLHERGLRSGFMRLCAHVARHTDLAVWEVVRQALEGRKAPRWLAMHALSAEVTRLVDPDVRASGGLDAKAHPWFAQADEASPSLSWRLGSVLHALDFYDWSVPPEATAPRVCAPLDAQPVVELCLRIPSYVHLQGGRDRGLARAAFSTDLPAPIIERRWKDRAPGFLEAVLARHRAFVRSFLLDGVLVRERLLAHKAVEEALSDAPSANRASPVEVMNHLSTETWARRWLD